MRGRWTGEPALESLAPSDGWSTFRLTLQRHPIVRPHLDRTAFGWIEIDGRRYEHDVLVKCDGSIERRKKKLSKRVYGTSHTISLDEAKHVYEKGARTLIVGAGQHGCVHLSEEAAKYFARHDVEVRTLPTPQVISAWNEAPARTIGLFHVTC